MRGGGARWVRIKSASVNLNQESLKRVKLTEIRAKHLEQLSKAADDKPMGRADRHVIAAWTEIEAEDRAEMEKVGTPLAAIEKKLLEARNDWIASTTRAWEEAQPKKAAAAAAEPDG